MAISSGVNQVILLELHGSLKENMLVSWLSEKVYHLFDHKSQTIAMK